MSMLPSNSAKVAHRSTRYHCLAIDASAAALVIGFGTLGATTRLAGAVIATGSIVVQSSVKKVSQQTGGLVDASSTRAATSPPA